MKDKWSDSVRWSLAAVHNLKTLRLLTLNRRKKSITPRTTSADHAWWLLCFQDPRPAAVPDSERVCIPPSSGDRYDSYRHVLFSPLPCPRGGRGIASPLYHKISRLGRRTPCRRIEHASAFRGAGLNVDMGVCVSTSSRRHISYSTAVLSAIPPSYEQSRVRDLALTTDQR